MFGGNFENRFWAFGRSSQSIEDILNREDCTLEMLMDDDELIQEFRNMNTKLLQFINAENVSKLLDFIVIEPPEGADEKRSFKYPFVAAEIFNCEIKDIIDLFFTKPAMTISMQTDKKEIESPSSSPPKDPEDRQTGQGDQHAESAGSPGQVIHPSGGQSKDEGDKLTIVPSAPAPTAVPEAPKAVETKPLESVKAPEAGEVKSVIKFEVPAPITEVKPVENKREEEKGAEAKPTEAKPAEVKPTEVKPAEPKTAEVKPAEAKPAETKPAETKPAETKPAETKPAETKPAEVKPVEAKPVEAKPAETKAVDQKLVEEKPAEAKPAEPKPAETKPAEPKPAEAKPAEPKPAEAKPAEPKPAETKPAESKPAETKPAEPKPAEPKPAETKPAEPKPAEPKPAETKAVEQKLTEEKPAEQKPTEEKTAEQKPTEKKEKSKPAYHYHKSSMTDNMPEPQAQSSDAPAKQESVAQAPVAQPTALVSQPVPAPEHKDQVPTAYVPIEAALPSSDVIKEDGDNVNLESPKEEDKAMTEAQSSSIPKYPLFEKLLGLLATKKEINPVLAGYFAKTMQILIEKRKVDVMDYLFYYKDHMENIVRHSYNKSIAEVLNKLLSNEDKYLTGATGEEHVEEKVNVLEKLIGRMSKENTIEDITNNCFILCSLIDSRQQLNYLLRKEVLKTIYDIACSSHPMSLRAGLTYIITVARLQTAAAPPQQLQDAIGFFPMGQPQPTEQKKEEEIDLTDLITLSIERMEYFKKYLEKDSLPIRTETQFGESMKSLGLDKLKVVEWLHNMVLLKNEPICKKIEETEFPKILLQLVNQYYMHSYLHLKVFNIFQEALSNDIPCYVTTFAVKASLPATLLTLWAQRKDVKYKATSKAFNKAYTVFITRLGNVLLELSKKTPAIAECLAKTAGWNEYANNDLKKTHLQETTPLCGGGKQQSPFSEAIETGKEEPVVVSSSDENSATADSASKLTSHGIENPSDEKHEIHEEPAPEEEKEGDTDVKLPTAEDRIQNLQGKKNQNEPNFTDEEEKKSSSETSTSSEEKPSVPVRKPSVETQIEEPIESEFASNNYWRADQKANLDEILKDFSY